MVFQNQLGSNHCVMEYLIILFQIDRIFSYNQSTEVLKQNTAPKLKYNWWQMVRSLFKHRGLIMYNSRTVCKMSFSFHPAAERSRRNRCLFLLIKVKDVPEHFLKCVFMQKCSKTIILDMLKVFFKINILLWSEACPLKSSKWIHFL